MDLDSLIRNRPNLSCAEDRQHRIFPELSFVSNAGELVQQDTVKLILPAIIAAALADGSQGYRVTCGGAIFSQKRAAEICGPRGFQILSGGTESTPYAVVGANVNANSGPAYGTNREP